MYSGLSNDVFPWIVRNSGYFLKPLFNRFGSGSEIKKMKWLQLCKINNKLQKYDMPIVESGEKEATDSSARAHPLV